ncbi:MAG: 16S rRNA (cytidine(1402)-2'-O)-methyltransferase [Candidatus Omnitrophica bacterium]|nr:16S rRNA (cytidine(1402)-2'-O)-methyltransferase [Candidatus Omnitrophota bacterium]
MQQGILYIVSTPIGNLKDISLRALEVLESVHLIAAEDTRRTKKLLLHYKIKTSLVSYFDYNKAARADLLLKKLKEGRDVALVSDAGTPCISDPGFYLAGLAIKENIVLTPIPGASALLSALVVSGAPPDRFVFEGYLPRKSKKRELRLKEIVKEKRTVILYEAPHRLLKTLRNLLDFLGDKELAICRELTKKFEEVKREKISELITYFENKGIKGEFVIVIPGAGE